MWDDFCRSLRGEAPLSVMADDTCASFARRQKGEQAVWGAGGCLFFFFKALSGLFAGTSPPRRLGRCAPIGIYTSKH